LTWRAGIALAILAFIGGGLAIGWLSSAGLSPWAEEAPAAAAPVLPEPEIAPPPSIAGPPVMPQVIQPIADSARTEAMLVAMSARRAIEAGAPLGALLPRLQASFAGTHPDAIAKILAADKERLTAAKLLADFDVTAPSLRREPAMTWQGLREEASQLFVIRRSNSAPMPVDAQLQRARDYLAGGNVEAAMRLVVRLPGAANAQGWTKQAKHFVETQKALETIEQAALNLPVAIPPPAPTPATPAPTAIPDEATL
jgi:hypothetical protein